MTPPAISALDLALSATLLLLNAGLSLLLGLGLARSLLIAALRTVVQLLLVGMVWVWDKDSRAARGGNFEHEAARA